MDRNKLLFKMLSKGGAAGFILWKSGQSKPSLLTRSPQLKNLKGFKVSGDKYGQGGLGI